MRDSIGKSSNVVLRYRLRRLAAVVSALLLCADFVVAGYFFGDLHQRPADPFFWIIALGCGAVAIVCLAAFLISWRCPVCHRWLGGLGPYSYNWLRQPFCPKCGAVFVSTAGGRQNLSDAAIRKEAQYYRERRQLRTFGNVVLIVVGVFFAVSGFVVADLAPLKWWFLPVGLLVCCFSIVLTKVNLFFLARERDARLRKFREEFAKTQDPGT